MDDLCLYRLLLFQISEKTVKGEKKEDPKDAKKDHTHVGKDGKEHDHEHHEHGHEHHEHDHEHHDHHHHHLDLHGPCQGKSAEHFVADSKHSMCELLISSYKTILKAHREKETR